MNEEQNAGEQPVEKATEINESEVSQTNYAEQIAKLEEENQRLAEEKENYRKGMLKAKGKLVEETPEEDDSLDALIERKVQEKLFATKEAQIERQKQDLLAKALKENEELKLAIKNRTSGGSSSMGSNQDKGEVKTSTYFSPEQIADLRKRAAITGADPDKFVADVIKNMQQPGQFGSPKIPQ